MGADMIFRVADGSTALKHPWAAISHLAGRKHAMHRVVIEMAATHLFGNRLDWGRWQMALDEIKTAGHIPMNRGPGLVEPAGNALRMTLGKWIYCAIRAQVPKVVVETGVANGNSSWVILNALRKNKTGVLHSIDLPNRDPNRGYHLGAREPGWVVPEVLRSNWKLHLGSSTDILPQLLGELGEVELFFHDSDHSEKNMTFEFETVLPFLRKDGLIVSDDIDKSTSFQQIVYKEGFRAISFGKGGAFIKN